MTIKEKYGDNSVTFIIEGNLDTTTAPLLEERLSVITEETEEVVFDFAKLNYISSAGLRTILIACKKIGNGGAVKAKDANVMVQDILNTTGFSEIIELV